MSAPDFWGQPDQAKEVNREFTHLRERLEQWRKLERDFDDAKVLLELAQEEDDEASAKEADQNLDSIEKLVNEIKLDSLLSGKHDSSNAILSLNSGAGGTEAQDWTEMLLRMYLRYAERSGFEARIVDILAGEEAGVKNVTVSVNGHHAYGRLKAETGVHRLVRISPFDANKRRHTSFAAVFVMPDIEEDIEIDVRPEDIRVDTYRAGGHGGQHVNKTDSAVRITHIPTGIVVQCQNERSQHKNRAMAMKVLKAKLYEHEEQKREEQLNREFHSDKKDIEWGSQIRSYVLQPYQMVKDLRTGYESPNPQDVLDGNLEPFIEAYLKMEAADRNNDKDK